MSSYKDENRKRLINLIGRIKSEKDPVGWKYVTSIAVGGLIAVGFSKRESNLLLVVSSSGRSVIDCNSGNKIERD